MGERGSVCRLSSVLRAIRQNVRLTNMDNHNHGRRHGVFCGVIWFALLACLLAAPWTARGDDPGTIVVEASHEKLERAFHWAAGKALSYVQTGKMGPLNRHERDQAGSGTAKYIPCYWAGYPWRTAFYSRDYCHQSAGAHLLGLRDENLSMLRAFAGSATAGRKWYPSGR